MAKSFPNTGVTIIDASADLPSSPVEGLMVFQKDTNELKIYDGSNWRSVLDTDTPPGMTLITTGTGTGTGFAVDNVFSSSFLNYKIILRRNAAPSIDCDLLMQLRTGGSTAATSYQTMGQYIQDNGTLSNYVSSNNSVWYLGGLDAATSGPYYAASFDIYSPYESAPTFMAGNVSTVATSGYSSGMWISHNRSAFVSHDGFYISAGGTATINISYKVYGYRDSI